MLVTKSFSGIIAALALSVFVHAGVAQAQTPEPLPDYITDAFGVPPNIPDGPLADDIQKAAQVVFNDSIEKPTWGDPERLALLAIAQSKDPRLAWLVSDMMRFAASERLNEDLTNAASELLQKEFRFENSWGTVTDHLLAWDIPAPPDYLTYKRAIFTGIVPGWDKIFVAGDIDWRQVSWGGVLIDDRPYDTTDEGCNCIPAADNPEVSSAEDATWLTDDAIVFGIEVNGAYRAYPRQIM